MTTRSAPSSPAVVWRHCLRWVGSVGRRRRARELRDRVWRRKFQLDDAYDAQMIDETIILAREAYELSSESEADRLDACLLLAELLRQRLVHHEDEDLLEETITLGREALTLSHKKNNPYHYFICRSLAISLKIRYEYTGDIDLVVEAIDLEREVLDLRPEGHPDRSLSCGHLADSLRTRYERTGDVGLLNDAISLAREALNLRPPGHPDRSTSCEHLSIYLWTHYQRTGDVGLLDEAIDLQREALDLRPPGHPSRLSISGNLAMSLWTQHERTGVVALLDEAINLQREALDLSPSGHPDRSWSCGSLANSLTTHYQRTGDVGLIHEAINLQREALDINPVGHPRYPSSCGDLAQSLWTQYKSTGDVGLLDEAIDLQHEALNFHPEGHPNRAKSCGNLANLLRTRYEHTGDVDLLDEAIVLQREALNLSPVGHLDRCLSCENLATSLITRYEPTSDVDLLNEIIDLLREALHLSVGHPDRYISCGNLATSLNTCYKRTGDVTLLHESVALAQETIKIAPTYAMWRQLHSLTDTHLQITSPSYDVSKAILYLSQSLENDPDDTLAFVISLSYLLDELWECNLVGKHLQLTTIYQRFVNLLPFLVHPTLDLQPQLQALKACTRVGSDAFANAALADNYLIGLETLELAQGVIWSTSLHRRDPQLKDVPEHLASQLQGLLQSFAMRSVTQPDHKEWGSFLSLRDTLHAQSSRAYAIIREIRELPGLDRFMLGESFETLRSTASNHPVVVLVGARGHYYALILAPSLANERVVLSIDLSDEELISLSFTCGSTRARRCVVMPEETSDEGDRAGLKKTEYTSSTPLDSQLQTLWHKIVKPVLVHLGLEVSDQNCFNDTSLLIEKRIY
jgi:tetratricopeptide (TPR) repeat protein